MSVSDERNNNEMITLSLIVGYCYSALINIQGNLADGEYTRASNKTFEALKFIKDKTAMYQSAIELPKEDIENDGCK